MFEKLLTQLLSGDLSRDEVIYRLKNSHRNAFIGGWESRHRNEPGKRGSVSIMDALNKWMEGVR